MKVVIRADAGPEIGAGHVMRCLSLAEALKEGGANIRFVVNEHATATVPALQDSGFELLAGPPGQTSKQECAAQLADVQWLVVDHRHLGAEFETGSRQWARRVLVLEDLADREHDCDVLLDQTLGREVSDYAGLVPGSCRILTGPQYALLRKQFPQRREASLARRTVPVQAKKVLVTFGATDPDGVSARVLEALETVQRSLKIDLVIGRDWPDEVDMRIKARHSRHQVQFHQDVRDMARLMAAADFSVGAGGSTSWERACLGVPTLVIQVSSDQAVAARYLAAAGAVVDLGYHADLNQQRLSSELVRLLDDADVLAGMSASAAAICDGTGAQRVAAKMLGMVEHE